MRIAAIFLFFAFLSGGAAHALTCAEYSRYEISGGRVTFESGGTVEVLRGVDGRTFRQLSPRTPMGSCRAGYAADRNTVLYEGKRVKDADVATFRVISANQWAGISTLYAKDRYRVYGEGVEISKAVDSFRVLDGGYATDGNRGFVGAKALSGEGFTTLGHGMYAKSTAAVFMRGEPLEGLDPQTFDVFRERPSYGRDAKKVIWWGRVIEGADPGSFAIVAATVDHAKDKFAVYYGVERIPGADPATIRQIDSYYFRDARAVYLEGKEIVGVEPSTFRVIHHSMFRVVGEIGNAADSKRVYRGSKPICSLENNPVGSLPRCP